MRHAVLPTDFSIRSLQPVHAVMQHCPESAVRITLLHLLEVPSAAGEFLLRLSGPARQVRIPAAFLHACELIANRYEDRLMSLKPLIRYGDTVAFTENLLQGLQADSIFLQRDTAFVPPYPASADTAALLRQCTLPVVEVDPAAPSESGPHTGVSALLITRPD